MKTFLMFVAAMGLGLGPSAASAAGRLAHAARHISCCRAPAGTTVEVELAEPVSTKVQKTGDTIALRLASPLVVDGRVLLKAGTPGVGYVVESAKPGMGGKAAKLVLAARYLKVGARHVAIQALQLSGTGHSKALEARAVGLTGIAFAPLGFIGLAVKGGDVEFGAGMTATAKLATDVSLPSLGPAPAQTASAEAAPEAAADELITIPPPPAGKGQVVFFRKKSILSLGQWFKVRESGKALGKLTNGAYFIEIADPGPHDYTATFEPELKDHLKLQVDAGETYFVEGTVTRALVVGAADLSPSDHAAFDNASKDLKPAPSLADPGDDKEEVGAGNKTGGVGAEPAPK
jgi:hypothetical protein